MSSVRDALGAGRVQSMMDKIVNREDKVKHSLALATFKNKPGDAYVDLKWVPEDFLEQASTIGMLTTLGFAWLYSACRACLQDMRIIDS